MTLHQTPLQYFDTDLICRVCSRPEVCSSRFLFYPLVGRTRCLCRQLSTYIRTSVVVFYCCSLSHTLQQALCYHYYRFSDLFKYSYIINSCFNFFIMNVCKSLLSSLPPSPHISSVHISSQPELNRFVTHIMFDVFKFVRTENFNSQLIFMLQ